jgi:DNA-binding protein H-NS
MIDIDGMSIDELSALGEKIRKTLAARLTDEKSILEQRLRQLTGRYQRERRRRQYPRVLPKYRNPDQPSETWSGRGKQPRWLAAQLRSGKQIDDFLIARPRTGKARSIIDEVSAPVARLHKPSSADRCSPQCAK